MLYLNGVGQGIDGARAEKVLDAASITLNKNYVPGYMNFHFVYLYIEFLKLGAIVYKTQL